MDDDLNGMESSYGSRSGGSGNRKRKQLVCILGDKRPLLRGSCLCSSLLVSSFGHCSLSLSLLLLLSTEYTCFIESFTLCCLGTVGRA